MPDLNDNRPRPWIDRIATDLADRKPGSLSRRSLGLAGLLSAATGLVEFGGRTRASAALSDADTNVLDDACVAEGLMETFLAVARTRASDMVLSDTMVRLVRTSQCQDGAHFDNLTSLGGSPSIQTYTIPESTWSTATDFLTTWLDLVGIMVGMYMSAARQTAKSATGNLVEVMYQIGTIESQHVALIRQEMGERLPSDRAFTEWQFRSTAEAITRLSRLGFIGGSGTAYDYPGPGERYCRGVTGLVAETTADQTAPDVTAAPASPESSPAARVKTL